MNDLKELISYNIQNLRKKKKLTQVEFANELHYSDKAISKWERAESIPDVVVLKQIADFFGVSLDYLLSEHNSNNESLIITKQSNEPSRINKLWLSLLSASSVWLIGTIVFTIIALFLHLYKWFIFYICVPITILLFLIFNSIWGKKRRNYFIVSCFVWSILLCIYLCFLKYNPWQIFILGIPAQVIILLWSKLKK